MRREHPSRGVLFLCLAILVAVTVLLAEDRAAPPRPSFVFFLIDDLGWTDLSSSGSTFYCTPSIDQLAAQSMRFTCAYAASGVGSPTRAAVLTGKHPVRLRLTDGIPGDARPWAKLRPPDWTQGLPPGEETLAAILKREGYATALIGKWHLGGGPGEPESRGFQTSLSSTDREGPLHYFSPYGLPGISDGPEGEYLTDRLTDEAVKFIEANRARPFFLFLSHFAMHTPIEGKKDLIDKYRARVAKNVRSAQLNPGYGAMLESLDEGVGRVIAKLTELGLDGNTVVLFASGNGGLVLPASRWGVVTSNFPLRAGKGSGYEGGLRVPLFIRWPGKTRAGANCSEPVVSMDLHPTILEIAGVKLEGGRTCDGVSLAPLLAGSGTLSREALYWHYPHYHAGGISPYGAVRQGSLKLIESYEEGLLELYDLKRDPIETVDLSRAMPEKAEELRKKLLAWREEMKAQMPSPNPAYDPDRADRSPEKDAPKKDAE